MQSGPSVIALTNPAFLDALAVSAAAILARVHAAAFDLHEIGVTLTLARCYALTVIAILAVRHASASVSRSILRNNLCSESEVRIQDESIVAFADLGRDARAVVAGRADRLASAIFRISITVETRTEIWRRARTVAAFDFADRLASKWNVSLVVINHTITVLANAEIGRLADTICFADRMTDRVARVRLRTRRWTIARIAAAHVGLHADTVLATGIANGLAEARTIAFGRLVAGVAGAFVRRGAMSIDATSFAEGFAYV